MSDAEYHATIHGELEQARWWLTGHLRAARRRYWPSWADPIERADRLMGDVGALQAQLRAELAILSPNRLASLEVEPA